MTNPTPHGQVPEALIDLIDEYAETRHRCGGVYNAKTEAARKAVIEDLREALGGVQALSAAPAGWRELAAKVMDALADAQDTTNSQYPEHVRCYPSWERHARWLRWHADMFRSGNPVGNGAGNPDVLAALAASPTPPAEQQATYKAVPGVPLTRDQIREVFMAHGFTVKEGHTDLKQYVYDAAYALLAMGAAPQQEAQEPVAWESTTPGYIKYITQARYEKFSPAVRRWYKPYRCSGCAERGAGFDACDMATAAAQGFRSGQAAAKQEE